jgi:prolyl-tRNA editing enzyme YbaK/EbsC (Cys-tRNA(Pro) deacylase)
MSLESVRNYFKKWNMDDRIQEFHTSSATVEAAAVAVNCEEKEIAKTIAFKINDKAILIVMAGDAKIDNQNMARLSMEVAKILFLSGEPK